MSPGESKKARLAFWGAWLTVVFWAIGPVLLSAVANVDALTRMLNRASADGKSPFDRAFFEAIVFRSRIYGGMTLALAAVALASRRRAAAWIKKLAAAARRDAALWPAAFRRARRGAALRWIALAAIMAAGAAPRVAYLSQPLRYDESYTWLRLASKPLIVAISYYPQPNNHIFHTVLVHLSARLFGAQLWAIRLPACLAGLLMIPAAYLAIRLHLGRRAGLFAAALVAASPALIDYSTNARGYTLIGLLTLASLSLAWLAAARPRDPIAWAALAVTWALGLFTIPLMIFPMSGAVAWLGAGFLRARGARRRTGLIALVVTVIGAGEMAWLLYGPALVVSGPKRVFANDSVSPTPLARLWGEGARMALLAAHEWTRGLPTGSGWLLAAGAVLSLAFPGDGPPCRRRRHWLVPMLLGCLAVALGKRSFGQGYPRVWLFLLPLFFGFAAAGWIGLGRRVAFIQAKNERSSKGRRDRRARPRGDAWAAMLAVALAAGLCAFAMARRTPLTLNVKGRQTNMAPVGAFLARQAGPGDCVIAYYADMARLEYEFRMLRQSSARLLRQPSAAQSAWLVTDEGNPNSEPDVSQAASKLAGQFGPRRVVARFDDARVERMDRH